MNKGVLFLMAFLVMGFCIGCENKTSDEHWYSGTKEMDTQRKDYVEFQQMHGATELEAKEAWQADQMIGNTQNRYRPVESSGDELQEKLGR
jgi:hypothetical protein